MPLAEALMFVHNALVGTGVREHIKIDVSGKVASGIDIVKRICQGADFTPAVQAMRSAVRSRSWPRWGSIPSPTSLRASCSAGSIPIRSSCRA